MRGMRSSVRKGLAAALAAALSLALTGCWSAREIDRLAFVIAIGFDRVPSGEGYVVTFRVVDPGATAGDRGQGDGGSAGHQPQTLSVAIEAESPVEALDAFLLSVARRPLLSHVQGIFIGEELAREGIDEVVDFLERHPEVRRSATLLVTRGSAAARLLLDAARTLRSGSGVVSMGLLEQAPDAGSIEQVRLGDFVEWLGSGEREAYAPAVELAPVVPPSVGRLPSAAPVPGEAEGMSASSWQFRLAGIAVFRGSRLAGFLEGRDAFAFALAKGAMRRGIATLDRYGFDGTVEIVNVDPSLRLRVEESHLAATLHIGVEARIATAAGPPRASRSVDMARVERAVESLIESEVGRMLTSLQAWGADALGIGRQLHARRPAVWHEVEDRWPEAFSQVAFSVSAQARLVAAGPVAGR